MSTAPLTAVVHHLQHLASIEPNGRQTDPQLLAAFVDHRDESAFTELVHRHGPLVLGVCRRALQHDQDAEDAFQATFLVLAEKAPMIRNSQSIAAWLHGVSMRIAMKVRRSAARRKKHEERAETLPAPGPAKEVAWKEVQTVLDEEIQMLPVLYREPFVLCYLEGLSKSEVARHMDIKVGTISSRLTHARRALRERLARRGIELSALLGAIAVTGTTSAEVPAMLRESTCRQVGAPGAQAPRGAFLQTGRMKAVGAAAFLLGAILIGSWAPARSIPVAAKPKANPLEVKGTVQGPDGKSLANATLTWWHSSGSQEMGKTDAEGRFRITLSKEQSRQGALVATNKSMGPAWISTRNIGDKAVTLKLVKDELPITGLLLDLEGRPVQGATIIAQRIGEPIGRTMKAWVDHAVARRKNGFYVNDERLSQFRMGRRSPWSTTTDQQGKFTIAGIGKDRIVRLKIMSDAIQHSILWAVTLPGPKSGWINKSFGLYPCSFQLLVAPGKTFEGVVRDRKTGKPVPGVIVADGRRSIARTTTDSKGRYTLTGVEKRKNYTLVLAGTVDAPYLDLTRFDIADTPGTEPVKVDFQADRGIVVRGKLTDTKGRPVQGSVSYLERQDNPRRKDFPSLDGIHVIVSDWGRTDQEGRYQVLTIPGPGVLIFHAKDKNQYVTRDLDAALSQRKVLSRTVSPTHAMADINPSETKPISKVCNVQLHPAVSIKGQVLDDQGKLLPGAEVAGAEGVNGMPFQMVKPPAFAGTIGMRRHGPAPLPGANFVVHGLDAKEKRSVAFYHVKRKLGKVSSVTAGSKEPVQIRLEPLGSISGQLVDKAKKPVAGVELFLFFDRDYLKKPSTPIGIRSGGNGSWMELLLRRCTTDRNGRFQFDDVLHDVRYEISGRLRFGPRKTKTVQADISVRSGKQTQLKSLQWNPK